MYSRLLAKVLIGYAQVKDKGKFQTLTLNPNPASGTEVLELDYSQGRFLQPSSADPIAKLVYNDKNFKCKIKRTTVLKLVPKYRGSDIGIQATQTKDLTNSTLLLKKHSLPDVAQQRCENYRESHECYRI